MVSHTTTGEWQSFETRMLRRRAERLALRAQAAVDAGCFEDARTCLSEARALAPTLSQLDNIEQQLPGAIPSADAPRLEPEAAGSNSGRSLAIAAMVTIAATVALGAWVFLPGRKAAPEGITVAAPPVRRAPVSAPIVPDPLAVPSAVFAEETAAAAVASGRATLKPPAELPAPKPPAAQPEPQRQKLLAAVESTTDALPPVRRPEPQARPDDVPVGRESVPMRTSAAATSTPAVAAPAPVAVLDLPVAPPASPPAEPPPAEPSQEPAVRTVLNRYASAYSALDAAAAQRVWPGVNRTALARAFDSLASQQISLGDCRIDVAGASATARCRGMATWSPKIGGGGRQSESRNWTFELARAASGWEIVSARVQNR